jgi:uncharacterized protein YfeS
MENLWWSRYLLLLKSVVEILLRLRADLSEEWKVGIQKYPARIQEKNRHSKNWYKEISEDEAKVRMKLISRKKSIKESRK